MGRVYTDAQAEATRRYMRDKRKITLVMDEETYRGIAEASSKAEMPMSHYIMGAIQMRMEGGK